MKNKNYVICFSLILLIAFILVSCSTKKILPDSFTINFYSIGGSSGAGEGVSNGSLTFLDGNVISGEFASSVNRRSGYESKECILNLESLIWQNKISNEACLVGLPLTINGLELLMNAPKNEEHLSEMKSCTHGELCYELV